MAIFLQCLDLNGGNRVSDGSAAGLGRNVVVDGRDGPIGLAHAAAGRPQTVKGLRRSDLVNQVQVYIEKRQPVRWRIDHVFVPDLLE